MVNQQEVVGETLSPSPPKKNFKKHTIQQVSWGEGGVLWGAPKHLVSRDPQILSTVLAQVFFVEYPWEPGAREENCKQF